MHNELKDGQYLSLEKQTKLLSDFIITIEGMPEILKSISHIPNSWVGAGVIFQNVWNVLHEYEINSHVKDIDIFYWDDDLSWAAEDRYIREISSNLSHINLKIDVKNIARVHLWYEKKFSIPKKPYKSVEESISTWAVLGTCIAMRNYKEKHEFIAPYGFQDMFALRIRPNKVLVNKKIYEDKVDKWKESWPLLSVEKW